jgi:ADP-heptose:LPS heptosyltransferase
MPTHQRLLEILSPLRRLCPPLYRIMLRALFFLRNAGIDRSIEGWLNELRLCFMGATGTRAFGQVEQLVRMGPVRIHAVGWCITLSGEAPCRIEVHAAGNCIATFALSKQAYDAASTWLSAFLFPSRRTWRFSSWIDLALRADSITDGLRLPDLVFVLLDGTNRVEFARLAAPQAKQAHPAFLTLLSQVTVCHRREFYYCHAFTLDREQPVRIPPDTSFLRFDKLAAKTSIRRILVLKLDHIGDFILALPALRRLAASFPSSRITIVVGPWNVDFARRLFPAYDVLAFELFQRESAKGRSHSTAAEKQLGRSLRATGFDLAIDLRRTSEARSLLYRAGSRISAAYTHLACADRLDLEMPIGSNCDDISFVSDKPHITAQMLALIQGLGGEREQSHPLSRYLEHTANRAWRTSEALRVFIHCGAGNDIKRYPWERLVHVINILAAMGMVRIELVGSHGDHDMNSRILGSLRDRKNVGYGGPCVSVLEFMERITNAHVLIGNDSGPCHVASFMGIPTLTIFSNQAAAAEWMPIGPHAIGIQTFTPCGPCYRSDPATCPFDVFCIRGIDPQTVVDALKHLIKLAYRREL